MIATRPPEVRRAAARWARPPRGRWLPHLLAVVLLAGLPFATSPGDIISDSKFELAVNPAGFLHAAFTLWNTQQFGQIQDQVAGYLFPMGPFFELLKLVNVDGWIGQRLWLGLVFVTAYAGVVRLARRLGIGSPVTRVLGGLVYALSPGWRGSCRPSCCPRRCCRGFCCRWWNRHRNRGHPGGGWPLVRLSRWRCAAE
jgi:arabinofuranan 3-O-arabinosyltransferase